MNEAQIRNAVIDALRSVAPEADPAALADTAPLRDTLDLDSMDFLNFVVALHGSLGVDIPEADYGKVRTLRDTVGYLAAKLPA
jgi:acyl carrier protein